MFNYLIGLAAGFSASFLITIIVIIIVVVVVIRYSLKEKNNSINATDCGSYGPVGVFV